MVQQQPDPDSDYVSVMTSNGNKLVSRKLYEKELKEKNLTKEQKQKALEDKKVLIEERKYELKAKKNRASLDNCDWCYINHVLYAITMYGAKLRPLEVTFDQEHRNGAITKKKTTTEWNGYQYERNTAGTYRLLGQRVFLQQQCRFFEKTGYCGKGDKCKQAHNKAKVMLCPRLIKGGCTLEKCSLSHEPTEFNVPLCHFYQQGYCKNEHCMFLHVSPEFQLVCRPFAIGGYCFRGSKCKFRHVHECPDTQLGQACPRGKNCRLSHRTQDNVQAKLELQTLDPKDFQLPDLTNLTDIHNDPRLIIEETAHEEEIVSDTDSDDDGTTSHLDQDDDLEINADFVHF